MAQTIPPPATSWSDIPLDLAGLVLRRLPARADRVRFAAVCLQWRRAAREVPLPAPLPLLALPDGTVYSLPGTKRFRFPGCEGYVDACGSWLAFSGEDGCFLRNPFTNATVTLPQHFRVQVQDPFRRAGDETGLAWTEMEDAAEQLTIYKLVFCSPQLIAAFVRFRSSARVAVCQPGAASWWSVHMGHRFPKLVDMAFHRGNLYVVDCIESLFRIDISVDDRTGDPWVSRVLKDISCNPCRPNIGVDEDVTVMMLYLVELHGALLMVSRKMHGQRKTPVVAAGAWYELAIRNDDFLRTVIPTRRNEFEVFRADFQQSKWSKVTAMGDDQVLFLRRRCSRFVRVSQEEMPGDRIVFMDKDNEDHSWCEEDGSTDSCSVYDLRDGSISAFAPGVSWKPSSVPATWLFPQD
ncbi:unnamed protein product [Urochloa humidicola]